MQQNSFPPNQLKFKLDPIPLKLHFNWIFRTVVVLAITIAGFSKLKAQHPLGLMVGDFNSPYSYSLNPALARTNPGNRAYVNWWGASLSLENNFMKYNAPIRLGAWIREDYPAEFTNINGSLAFQQNWLPVDRSVQDWKLNYLNEVYSPSFFFPIEDIGAFGFGVKSVSGFSINGLNPQFGSIVRYGMPEIQNQIGQTINQSEFSINTEKYQEWFFTFAGYDNPSKIHSWRWGVTAKMLLGMGIAHLGSDNLSFNVIDDKTVNINQLNSRLYYSAGSMRTMQNPFGLKFDWVEGVGLGTDLGVIYEYRPNALKYKGFDWCESEKSLAYSWKFGMSITDLGFISYWGNSSNITSLGNQQWKINPNIIQNGQFTTGDEKLQDLSQNLFQDLGADETSEFLSYSPAALNIQYDKAINQNLHLGAYWTQSLKGKNSVGLRRASYLSIVPRWQSERVEIGLPLTLANDYTAQHVGIYARFGPFIAGTDNIDGLGKFLANDNYSGGNFYFGFRSKLGGCDRPRNKRYSVIQHETYNDTQIKRDTVLVKKVITDTIVKTERKTATITKQVVDTVYQTNKSTVTLPGKNNAQIELVKVKEDIQKSQADLGKVKADLSNTQTELAKVKADLSVSNAENQKNKAEMVVLKEQNAAKDAEIARVKADLLTYSKKCDEDKKALQDYLDKVQAELALVKKEKAKIAAENEVLKNQVDRLSAATVGLSCEKQLKSLDSALVVEKTNSTNAQIELTNLKNKMASQENEINRLKAQIEALNREKLLLNDKITLLETQKKLCQSELDKLKTGTQAQIELVNQNNDLKIKLANAEKQLAAISLERENCNKQLAVVKAQLDACSKNTGSSSIDAENCKKQLAALQADKTSLETKNAQLVAQVQTLTTQVNTLNSQINASNAQINTLKADLATANSKVNSLNSQVSGLNAQITSLNAQIATLTADKKACEEKLAKTSSNISVSEDCTPYKNKVKELELKTADLELKNKTLETQNSTLTAKNTELEAAVKTNESTLSQLKATISKQAADIENLKAESSKCESDKTAISVQLEVAKKKIAELEMAAGSSNNSELTAQVNTLNSQVSALKEQLQSKESQLQTANNKIASMESKIALLAKQLAECNSIVNAAKTDLDECLKAKSILEGDESRLRKQIIQMDEDMGKLSEIIKSNSAEISKLKAENAALTLKLKECQIKLNPTPEAP